MRIFAKDTINYRQFVCRRSECILLRIISQQITTTSRKKMQWTALESTWIRIHCLQVRSAKSAEVCLEVNASRKRITPMTREDHASFSRSTRFVVQSNLTLSGKKVIYIFWRLYMRGNYAIYFTSTYIVYIFNLI